MRIIKLAGGLGNQLYQYAYGCYLERHGAEVRYNIDYFNKGLRPFSLKLFNCSMLFSDKKPTDIGDHGKYHYLKYVYPVGERLINEIILEKPFLFDSKNSLGIHVRRGDYINHPRFVNLGMDYYSKAMKLVKGKRVYIFSDDLDWCKSNLSDRFVYVDYPDYICFDMLRRCKNKIIANSTFSWWAAYLGSGSVVSPSRWFHDPVKQERAINQIPSIWQII